MIPAIRTFFNLALMKQFQRFEILIISLLVLAGLLTACATGGGSENTIADYTLAIELDPGHADAYIYQGLAYGYSGDLEKAIADYERALKIGPNAPNLEVWMQFEEWKLELTKLSEKETFNDL